jgi:hypothetical protein
MKLTHALIALVLISVGHVHAKSELTGDELKALAIVYADFQKFEGPRNLPIYKVTIEKMEDEFRITFLPPLGRIWTEKGKVTDTIVIAKGPGRHIAYVISRKSWRVLSRTRDRD